MAGVPGSSHGLNVAGYVLRRVLVITASTTYTVPTSVVAAWVEVTADGGGGAGTPATTGTGNGQNAAGGGGGGGGWSAAWLTSLAASYTVTVGTGGTATAGAGGGNGGGSSFGTAVVAEGGLGAAVAVRDVGVFPDSSGTPARGGLAANGTGDYKLDGGSGFGGWLPRLGFPWAGGGGDAPHGGGQRLSGPSQGTIVGQAGRQYGGGGGGASAVTSAAAQAGGVGAPGVVVVYEYMQT